jgi:hypothetical protein
MCGRFLVEGSRGQAARGRDTGQQWAKGLSEVALEFPSAATNRPVTSVLSQERLGRVVHGLRRRGVSRILSFLREMTAVETLFH